MIDKIKKLIKLFFGSDKDIRSTFGISLFFTGLCLSLFAFMFETNSRESIFLIYASSICFFLWILMTQGVKTADKCIVELIRVVFVLFFLSCSLSISLKLKTYNSLSFYAHATIMTILLLICAYYFVSKIKWFLLFIKRMYFQIKNKLFPNKTENRLKMAVENATAFLASLSGLIIAVGTIITAIIQVFSTVFK